MKAFSLPSFTVHPDGHMGLQASMRDWLLARRAMKTVWTVARMRVEVQLPSKVAITEGWGTLVQTMERTRRDTRCRRSRGEGWLAGMRKLRMLTMVRRLDWSNTMLCRVKTALAMPKALLFRLMVNVILWYVPPDP